MTRTVDATIGPRIAGRENPVSSKLFLNYQVVAVASPDHPLVRSASRACGMLRQQTWLLGPSAAEDAGVTTALLHRIGVPEDRQQIFQSHAAALDETKRGRGISLDALLRGRAGPRLRPARAGAPGATCSAQGSWHISTLGGGQATPAAEEMTRFITTPRATQAMLRGRAVAHGRFKPAVHVTLWSAARSWPSGSVELAVVVRELARAVELAVVVREPASWPDG